ncbi:hypothetical protein ACONUD_04005 [Microbulbifer harenosus]|uniref:Lipocalin-like domain-containing protein n=1 Tax=Microbulbifer harenosus TaxID=2576840 RepID=A0ABY2UK83_9GAMM|nr:MULTISPECIES: hypothetical protein [Microbulbifer]QIL89383.1 hypothetical protein GNX18_06115 [Microbulbifer sp. SH-1]TLM78685.1 hypothetical protein FDY93_05380 [Microbulbifer harenosus]
MLKTILLLLGGFVAGIGSTIGLSMYFVYEYATQPDELEKYSLPDAEYSLSNDAYTNTNECHNFPVEKLLGNWYGQKTLDDGNLQKWKVTRFADGTYQIQFELSSPEGLHTSKESGLWSYSGCLYSVITKSRNGENVLFQEVYRVQDLTDKKLIYTNYRTGNTFTVIKGI